MAKVKIFQANLTGKEMESRMNEFLADLQKKGGKAISAGIEMYPGYPDFGIILYTEKKGK